MRTVPDFFDPGLASSFTHRPDVARIAAAADEHRGSIAPASEDARRAHLLLIDVQRDFCVPDGTLYVGGRSGRGAVEDSVRIARLVYEHLPEITDITCTLDSHFAQQIFFPAFWVDAQGATPAPHREVTLADLERGELRPAPGVARLAGRNREWLELQVRDYVRQLERGGRYKLYLWPYHCLMGSLGHSIVGIIDEARTFHSMVRRARVWNVSKGDSLLTESYSVLRPEVLTAHDGAPLATEESALLDRLLAADVVLVAGQAASHCVRSTLDDLLARIREIDPERTSRVRVLSDCMSSVAVPDGRGGFVADFTPMAEAAFERWSAAGAKIVKSTDPFA